MGACGYRVGGMPLPLILKTKRLSSRCSKLLQNCVNAQHSLTLYYLFRERLILAEKVLWLLVLLAIRIDSLHIISPVYFCHAGFHLTMLYCVRFSTYKSRLYTKAQGLCVKEKRQGGPFSTLSFSAGLCIPKDGPLLCLGMLPKSEKISLKAVELQKHFLPTPYCKLSFGINGSS